MAIKVRTESEITGSSEHVVTEEGLRAQGVDPKDSDPTEKKVLDLINFLEWLNTDPTHDGASPLRDQPNATYEDLARQYLTQR